MRFISKMFVYKLRKLLKEKHWFDFNYFHDGSFNGDIHTFI